MHKVQPNRQKAPLLIENLILFINSLLQFAYYIILYLYIRTNAPFPLFKKQKKTLQKANALCKVIQICETELR